MFARINPASVTASPLYNLHTVTAHGFPVLCLPVRAVVSCCDHRLAVPPGGCAAEYVERVSMWHAVGPHIQCGSGAHLARGADPLACPAHCEGGSHS